MGHASVVVEIGWKVRRNSGYIRLLLRAPIEPARVALPFCEPPAEESGIELVQSIQDRECSDAAEDLTGVGFGPRNAAKAAVEVFALDNECRRRRAIDATITKSPQDR
jgi:hypothetical protein